MKAISANPVDYKVRKRAAPPDGEHKILVTKDTEVVTFVPGSRSDLKPGETIFSGARVEGDGKFVAPRVAVSKDGVKPPQ